MQMLSSSKFDIYAKQNQAWYEGKDKLAMAEVCERILYRWKKQTPLELFYLLECYKTFYAARLMQPV